MNKFCTGNVIKTFSGSIEIVVSVSCDYTNTISFEYERSSSGHHEKSFKAKESCWDCDINDGGRVDTSCKTCKGTGVYMKLIHGMDKAILLAPTVKKYILERLIKDFDFN